MDQYNQNQGQFDQNQYGQNSNQYAGAKPNTNNTYETSAPKNSRKVGPIIIVVIIVLVLIIAGIYLFASQLNTKDSSSTPMVNIITENEQTTAAVVQPITNSSDDIEIISHDLNTATQGIDNQNF